MMTILKLLVSVILILFLINSGSINLYLIDFSYDNLIIYSFVIFLITGLGISIVSAISPSA